ncbi:hypothetical protein IFR05_017602, partial [Cadophora sp. M221]
RPDICKFYVRLSNLKRHGHATVTTYRPHTCPTSTHLGFKKRNAGWYIRDKFERDIARNKRLTVKDMQGRADVYHNMPNVGYMPMYRGRELVRERLDGNEGESFQLIPSYLEKLELMDPSTYTKLSLGPKMPDGRQRFQALFIALRSIITHSFHCVRWFFGLDGTHTRSRYGMTLLTCIGID